MKEFSPFEIRDAKGNIIYIENSKGFWEKREYDTNSKEVYFENSIGIIEDNRTKPVKEYSMDEIANKLGIPVEQLKIKK
jgi:hypothetical protein